MLKSYWLLLSYSFQRNYTATICNHETKKSGQVEAFGKKYILSLPLTSNGNPDYCLDCIVAMSIRCAWCGNTIRIGEPVTLYAPDDSYKVLECAVPYDEDKRFFVGCLSWGCADTGADRVGFWMPPGKVVRVPSPIDLIYSKLSEGKDPKMVIVNDLSDPNDLGRIVE